MTAALTAALRACAAGYYPSEAGTALLISHGGFLDRPGFTAFIHAGTSISDGITEMAEIDWQAAIIALHDGHLPLSGGFSEVRVSTLGGPTARSLVPLLNRENISNCGFRAYLGCTPTTRRI